MDESEILAPDEIEPLWALDLMRKFRRMKPQHRARRIADLIAECDALLDDDGHPHRSPEGREAVRAKLRRTKAWLASVADRLSR
jgi:hypothetical protein